MVIRDVSFLMEKNLKLSDNHSIHLGSRYRDLDRAEASGSLSPTSLKSKPTVDEDSFRLIVHGEEWLSVGRRNCVRMN